MPKTFLHESIPLVAIAVALSFVAPAGGQDLFEEAGHGMSKSRWVMLRLFPLIQVALEADDTVLVESIDHPAKALAMRIDGKAVAADCHVTETKDTAFTVVPEKRQKWTTATTTTSTTYWSSCVFRKAPPSAQPARVESSCRPR